MKTREEIITGMCYTWRHDYGLNKQEHDGPGGLITAGLTDKEREFLWNQMAQLFDNDILPHAKSIQNILAGAEQMAGDGGYREVSLKTPEFLESQARWRDIISNGGMDPRK